MAATNALEVDHLTKRFGELVVLDDISLQVRPGEIHAVLGENGAGKTTLMKILGGLYQAKTYQGTILVDGQPAAFRSTRDALVQGIAIVPRRPVVFAGLSVTENIVIGNWQLKRTFLTNNHASRQLAEETLQWAGISLDLDARVGSLTAGQKRMVTLARALGTHPHVLVLDEPSVFASGPSEISQLIRLLRQLAGQNIASLFLTRIPAEAAQIADRVTVLRDGVTVTTFERADFDVTQLAMTMLSQHPERVPGNDDLEETGGLMGQLSKLFSFGSRN